MSQLERFKGKVVIVTGAASGIARVVADRCAADVVNTASFSRLGGDWRMAAYNAAKGGVVHLTRAVAMDFGAKGGRVTAVRPSASFVDGVNLPVNGGLSAPNGQPAM